MTGEEVQEVSPAGVLGVSPIYFKVPQSMGDQQGVWMFDYLSPQLDFPLGLL
jgi:hypothetical protein